jgi:hypothetical protein
MAVLATTVAAALTLAMLAPRGLAPLAKHIHVGAAMASAEDSMNEGLGSLNDMVDKTINSAKLKLYDHPAPKEPAPEEPRALRGIKLPRLPWLGR